MKTSELFPTKYLRAADLADGPATDLMRCVTLETLKSRDGKEEQKPMLSFKNGTKPLILNKVNTRVIETAYGSDCDAWDGQPVELFKTQTTFGADLVDCVRVRIPETDSPF